MRVDRKSFGIGSLVGGIVGLFAGATAVAIIQKVCDVGDGFEDPDAADFADDDFSDMRQQDYRPDAGAYGVFNANRGNESCAERDRDACSGNTGCCMCSGEDVPVPDTGGEAPDGCSCAECCGSCGDCRDCGDDCDDYDAAGPEDDGEDKELAEAVPEPFQDEHVDWDEVFRDCDKDAFFTSGDEAEPEAE